MVDRGHHVQGHRAVTAVIMAQVKARRYEVEKPTARHVATTLVVRLTTTLVSASDVYLSVAAALSMRPRAAQESTLVLGFHLNSRPP